MEEVTALADRVGIISQRLLGMLGFVLVVNV
jgi:hypothetical protein